MYAITSMAMRKFLAKERMEQKRAKDRLEREKQALMALELCRIDEWVELQKTLNSAKWVSDTGKWSNNKEEV
jgi:hypothetical protein